MKNERKDEKLIILFFIEYTVSMFESTTGTKKWNVTFYEYSAREMTEDTPYGKKLI